jgi:pimeloyl-ACP methyl ester carboxylesterase
MNLNETTPAGSTSYLARPDGRIGYDAAGTGPLIVLVPGMGDLRAGYRFLAPALRAAGYRVACTDLRGHGDSDATFPSYGDEETAGDVRAQVVMVPEAGHYPQSQQPEITAGPVLRFLAAVPSPA